jgi:hypothetical protein
VDIRVGTPAPGGVRAVDGLGYPQLGSSPGAFVHSSGAFLGDVVAGIDIIQFETMSVPEPGLSWLMFLGGSTLLIALRSKRGPQNVAS